MLSRSDTARCGGQTTRPHKAFGETAVVFATLAATLAATLSLLPLASAQKPPGPQIAHSLCSDHTCYSLHLERVPFIAAHKACQGRGGMLTTMKTAEEISLLQELVIGFHSERESEPSSGATRKFWIGLRRNRRQCYAAKKPLRGFYWLSRDEDTSYSNWAKEPGGPCTVERCVTASYAQLDLDAGNPGLKWEDGNCNTPAEFACKYAYRGACGPADVPPGASVSYRLPFGDTDRQFGAYPEGTVSSVACADDDHGQDEDDDDDEKAAAVEFTCELLPDGFAWSGTFAEPLCGHRPAEAASEEDDDDDDDEEEEEEEEPSAAPEPSGEAEERGGCEKDNGGCEHTCFPSASERGEGGHRCGCVAGYRLDAGDGRSCVDIDECARGGGGGDGDGEEEEQEDRACEQRCVNTEGSYHCACERGYEMLEGRTCADVDECEEFPCEQFCENTPGSFACYCADGFTLDAGNRRDCAHYDPCALGAELCEHGCRLAARGDPECYCGAGYALLADGANCTDVDECRSSPCAGACVNTPGSFRCACGEGFAAASDGVDCVAVDGGGDGGGDVAFGGFAATEEDAEYEVETATGEYAYSVELSRGDGNVTTTTTGVAGATPGRAAGPTPAPAYPSAATVALASAAGDAGGRGETSTLAAVTRGHRHRPGVGSGRAAEERNSKPWLLVAIIFAGLLIVTVTTFLCFAKRGGGRKRFAPSGAAAAPSGAQAGVPLTQTQKAGAGPPDSADDVNETLANNEDLKGQKSLQNGS